MFYILFLYIVLYIVLFLLEIYFKILNIIKFLEIVYINIHNIVMINILFIKFYDKLQKNDYKIWLYIYQNNYKFKNICKLIWNNN